MLNHEFFPLTTGAALIVAALIFGVAIPETFAKELKLGHFLPPRHTNHTKVMQPWAKEVAKRTYAQGVAVTKEVVNSVRLGRASSPKKVKRAVQMIVGQVLNNETSIIGLTTLRDYDESTFMHSVNVCIFSVANFVKSSGNPFDWIVSG